MMMYLVGTSVFVLLSGLLMAVRYQQKKARSQIEPYRRRVNFYSNSERVFLAALMRALGGQYLILGKVKVSDLVGVEPQLSKRERVLAYESLMGKSVDFVLCDHRTSKILAVIDLVDPSIKGRKKNTTQELDLIFKSVSIPCIRFYIAQQYDVSDIRYAVSSFLSDLSSHGPLHRMLG